MPDGQLGPHGRQYWVCLQRTPRSGRTQSLQLRLSLTDMPAQGPLFSFFTPCTCHQEPAGTISDYALGKQRDAKGLAPGIKWPEDTFSNRVYRKTSKSQNNVISVNKILAEQNHMRYTMLLLIQEKLGFSFVGFWFH